MSDESTPYVFALVTENDLIGLFSSPKEAKEWARENDVVWNGVTRILHRAKPYRPGDAEGGQAAPAGAKD